MSYTNGLDKPTDYFNTVLYTGNGSTQSITGINFQPDWVWIKERDDTPDHKIYDVVRGATKSIESNTTEAESTNASSLTSFDSNGFSLGTVGSVNGSGDLFVSWNWLAGGSASSNTDGSITSSVSANTTAGFSIVSYTGNGTSGATIGHGLSSKPTDIFVKSRNDTTNWCSQHKALGATKFMRLNDTRAVTTNTARWNDTEPTSSVFSVGNDSETNQNNNTYIAYCFAEKKGFSRFGSYVGNGSSDGSYIHLGFKPAFVLLKQTNSTNYWNIYDNKRDIDNAVGKRLHPNTSDAETSNTDMDFTAQGFKLRNSGANQNGSGSTYIYMAFAENPFVTSTGIPTTAR